VFVCTDQMHEAGAGEPDADERRHELAETDAVGRLEDVQVLQHVGDGHQPQCSREPQTYAHTERLQSCQLEAAPPLTCAHTERLQSCQLEAAPPLTRRENIDRRQVWPCPSTEVKAAHT